MPASLPTQVATTPLGTRNVMPELPGARHLSKQNEKFVEHRRLKLQRLVQGAAAVVLSSLDTYSWPLRKQVLARAVHSAQV